MMFRKEPETGHYDNIFEVPVQPKICSAYERKGVSSFNSNLSFHGSVRIVNTGLGQNVKQTFLHFEKLEVKSFVNQQI